MSNKMTLREKALAYHQYPCPGKFSIEPNKPMATQEDLSLAYTPGVAEPVKVIAENPDAAYAYTNKGNLVAVISDGTAILGLGNRGALASKPVMEGKAVLFKKFANIDVFDIEVDAKDPATFIQTVMSISPTFGGINLEDIKAPECFHIEYELRSKLDIPVFHDDQHGTAVVVAAGLLNALELQNKTLAMAKIVCLGAGAAGLATMHLLIKMGAQQENVTVVDSQGVIHTDRSGLGPYKFAFARRTAMRTLSDAMQGADVFIGVSGPDLVSPTQIQAMAPNPVIFALSNPDPEIHPEVVAKFRPDAVIATGRSDFPNQVNNVLCFPYIFRGALDVRARCFTTSMSIAAAEAIRQIAKESVPAEVKAAYPCEQTWSFGPSYILPKPMDPRLRERVPEAVAAAAKAANVVKQG